MKVILFMSGIRCGKDEYLKALKQQLDLLGYNTFVTSFGGKVKEQLAKTLNIDLPTLDNLKNSRSRLRFGNKQILFRNFIINFAETMKEENGKNFWAEKVYKDIKENKDKDFILINDLGFMEEYLYLRNRMFRRNMYIVKINSNLPDCNPSNKKELLDKVKPDIVIHNDYKENENERDNQILDNVSIILNRVMNF